MLIAEYSNYINHFPSCYSVTGICFSDRQEPGALHVSVARYRQRETGVTAAGGKGLGEGAPTHGLAQRAGRPGGGGAAGGAVGLRRTAPGARVPGEGVRMRGKYSSNPSRCAKRTGNRSPVALGRTWVAHRRLLAAGSRARGLSLRFCRAPRPLRRGTAWNPRIGRPSPQRPHAGRPSPRDAPCPQGLLRREPQDPATTPPHRLPPSVESQQHAVEF